MQQQYQQPQPPTWFNTKHILALCLLGASFVGGLFLFVAGFFTLGLAWCFFIPDIGLFLVGLALLF